MPTPATKVKDLIKELQECDPEAYVRMPGDSMGIPLFVEQKPAYYDGGYWYFDEDEEKYIYTRTGYDKVDIYVKDLEDIVYDNDGDIDKIEKIIEYRPTNGREEFWKRVKSIARTVRSHDEQSIKRHSFDVIKKINDGYQVVQSMEDPIGKYNVMWYHEPGSKRRHRFMNQNSGAYHTKNNLRQGDCKAVLDSGLFTPVKNETENLIYWRLKVAR